MIIDSHVHVVSHDRNAYPLSPVTLPNGAWYLERPVDAQAMLSEMDDVGVDAAVLVQAKGAYDYDNSYVGAAAATSRRFTAVGVVEPGFESAVRELAEAGSTGARLFDIPTGTHADMAVDFAACAAVGLVAVPTAMLASVDALAATARANPATSVAVDHCLFADLDDGEHRTLLREAFVDVPSVHFKVSSHVLSHVADPVVCMQWLAATFGPERLLWGSDFPQTPDASYRELLALAKHACSGLSTGAQAEFLGGSALRLWPMLQR